jgi:hypothetical protein
MNRLEIIHLRLADATHPGLVEDIRRAIDTGGAGPAAYVYRHATLAGDLSIHLHFEFSGGEHRALGAHLARALKEHGMVEHTVWLEEA